MLSNWKISGNPEKSMKTSKARKSYKTCSARQASEKRETRRYTTHKSM